MISQKNLFYAALIFTLCFTTIFPRFCRARTPKKHVLLLNSYSKGYAWTDSEVKGVEDVLSLEKNLVLKTEYMDSKVLNSQEYYGLLRQLYEKKYSRIHLDAIITTDDDAFNFLKLYRDDLFIGVPVVFCGVNNFSDKKL